MTMYNLPVSSVRKGSGGALRPPAIPSLLAWRPPWQLTSVQPVQGGRSACRSLRRQRPAAAGLDVEALNSVRRSSRGVPAVPQRPLRPVSRGRRLIRTRTENTRLPRPPPPCMAWSIADRRMAPQQTVRNSVIQHRPWRRRTNCDLHRCAAGRRFCFPTLTGMLQEVTACWENGTGCALLENARHSAKHHEKP